MSLTTDEIKNRTVRGVKWNLIEQVGVYGITLIGTIILSRLLLPDEYGLFGMLVILANLATVVVGMGLGYSVIQNKALSTHDLSSIFWFNLFLGTLVAVLFFFAAPWIAAFYHQVALISITRWFCIVFIIQGAGSVPQGLLIKAVNFKQFTFTQVSAAFFSYLVAIVMATHGFGVLSLLGQSIAFYFIGVSGNLYFSKWKPSLIFSFESIKKIKSFSLNFLFSQLIDFSATNLDTALIGKYFGKQDLGFIGRATALAMLPVTSFGFVLNRTLFPLFSSLQNEKELLRYRYLQAIKILMLTIPPILILVGILSKDVVLLLFGPRWNSIDLLVSILAVYGTINCFNLFHDSFLISQGRTDLLLKLNIFEKSILVISVLSFIRFGILGMAWVKVAVTSVMFLPRLILVNRLINLKMRIWGEQSTRLLVSLMLLFLSAWFLNVFLIEQFFVTRLILVKMVSIAVYYTALIMLKEQALKDVQQYILSQIQRMLSKK